MTGYFSGTTDFDPGPGDASQAAACSYSTFIQYLSPDTGTY